MTAFNNENTKKVLDELYRIGIVPVVKIDNAEDALPLGEALIKGGIPCAEITFRTSTAKSAIEQISKAYPEMLVGAGTVLTIEQADEAVKAGAKFIVSPGFNPNVVRHCLEIGVPIVPGINNPTGIEQAMEMGLETVKFFPAEQSGGIEMIKAMSAPYGKMKFMPTGGIGPGNLLSYLSNAKIIACGGSWMVKGDMIAAKDFSGIEKLCREAVSLMLGFSLKHTAVNVNGMEECKETVNNFCDMFDMAPVIGEAGGFIGNIIEVMGIPQRGAYGHIAIGTNNVDRAIYHLSRKGVKFDMNSVTYLPDGRAKFVYLDPCHDVNGFAIHLINK